MLVIEVLGRPENEVFARVWCSFWGLATAMVNLKMGCVGYTIREAFVTGVSVVIRVVGVLLNLFKPGCS